MKKMVYQQPTTTIVVVEHMQMLAASGNLTGDQNYERRSYGKTTESWNVPNVKANGNYVDWDKE